MRVCSKVVANCAWGLAEYFHIVNTAGRFFNAEEIERLDIGGNAFLLMYATLSENSHWTLWHIIPKFHQFYHLLLDAIDDLANPAYFQCFGDEDFVGQSMILAGAQHPSTLISTAVDNFATGLRERLRTFLRYPMEDRRAAG